MNKEYILRLAQLIREYPTLPVMTWVDAESLNTDFDFCPCDIIEEPRIKWICRSDDPTDLEVLVSNNKEDDGLEWEEAICVYMEGL